MDKEKIGKFIISLRKEKNITQEELARALYVDRSVISKWESSKYLPNPEMLVNLSNFFDVSVNELLLGERENKNNKNIINEMPATLLKEDAKKRKKIIIISSMLILILIISFLSYYFINTYNSIKVYKLTGESEHCYVNDGVMIVSNNKVYINLSNIRTIGTYSIYHPRLYYYKKNEKVAISYNELNQTLLIINDYNNPLFPKEDIKYIMKKLIIEFEINNGHEEKYIETIELKPIKDFANSQLIFNVPN